jgi:hypothetical protein
VAKMRVIAVTCSLVMGSTLFLSACNSSNELTEGITVPALWANDAGAGGIEPAGIVVDTTADTPDFTVNLEDVDASGAGPAWRAATASAVATATLLSGVDPGHLSATYTISGPIDGPSAGAILTVGTLAAIQGRSLDPKVTMTGTVSPDGSIGRIGGVGTKIKAAADNGFDTVLLPTDNLFFRNANGERVDAVAYGTSVGVVVQGVDSIAEAYPIFTGHSISIDGALKPDEILDPIADPTRVVTTDLMSSARKILKSVPSSADRTSLNTAFETARRALGNDDYPTAYGLAADVYKRSAREIAKAQTIEMIRNKGSESARTVLIEQATVIRTRANAEIEQTRGMSELGQGQQALLPATLRWAVLADAYAGSVQSRLASQVNDEVIIDAAMTLASQRSGLDEFLPDSLLIRTSMSSSPAVNAPIAVDFASGYTHFLLAAANANSDYLDAVFDTNQEDNPQDKGFIGGAAQELAALNSQIPSDDAPLGEQVQGVAQAMAYYLLSSARVDALQVFGTDGFGSSVVYAEDAPAMERDIEATAGLVNAGVESLSLQGIDISGAAWGAAWAQGLSRSQVNTENAVAADSFALTEIWFSALSVQMLTAAKSA